MQQADSKTNLVEQGNTVLPRSWVSMSNDMTVQAARIVDSISRICDRHRQFAGSNRRKFIENLNADDPAGRDERLCSISLRRVF